MEITNAHLSLTINDRTGALTSLTNRRKRQLIHGEGSARSLFSMRFYDQAGAPIEFSSAEAASCTVTQERSGNEVIARIRYQRLRNLPVHVEVEVRCPQDQALTYWNCTVEHDTDWLLDWIEFPEVVVPNDLIGAGGDARILWPGFEGVLIDDIAFREGKHSFMQHRSLEYPCRSWEGHYPGAVPSQFMAYYGANGGLYLGAHDAHGGVKGIEFKSKGGGIRLETRLFVGAVGRGRFRLPYDMVIGVFDGDWHDAASIYRTWFTGSDMQKPPKLPSNTRVPAWLAESPVVVTYPVRGVTDTGDMTPNEYFPFTKALPHLERLAKEFDSPVMALLMHWEGSAPWAPPYVWPPLDEQDFHQFVGKLHAQKHYAGVYCSGIGWTQKSNLTDYDRSAQFEREGLSKVMCIAPDGSLPHSKVCTAQRVGYDLCPATTFTQDVIAKEVEQIVEAKVDYVQFFDQNEGGAAWLCYAKDHGHPPGPGTWQVDTNRAIHRRLDGIIAKAGSKALIGCEGAAADTYLNGLMFNDARFEVMYGIGTPIPLYGFLYHEYTFNFMGNQCCTHWIMDLEKSPVNLQQRIGHSFVSGDALTVVLKGGGQIHWSWGCPWTMTAPEQQPVFALIKNFNAWRRNHGKRFLYGGRMEKPHPLSGLSSVPIARKSNEAPSIDVPSMMTSRWTSADGGDGQFVVNYLNKPQSTVMTIGNRSARLVADPKGRSITNLTVKQGTVSIDVPSLCAVLIEFDAPGNV